MSISRILLIGLSLVVQTFGQNVTLPKDLTVLLGSGSLEVEGRDGKKRSISKDGSGSGSLKVIRLGRGESLQTSKGTSCDLVVPGTGTMRLQAESRVKLPAEPAPEPKQQRSLELLKGKLFLDVDATRLKASNQQFRLKTPTTILAVKGTRFFAATTEAGDTAGLHQGSVVVLESTSGKSASLKPGNALESKAGTIGKPRRLTPEEQAESALYQKFALDFTLAEKGTRKFIKAYDFKLNHDKDTEVEQRNKLMSVKKMEGKILKVTVRPVPESPKAWIKARATVTIKPPRREVPVGLSFSVRANGVNKFYFYGFVKRLKETNYGIPSMLLDIPEGTPPDQWVEMYVPVKAMQKEDILYDAENNISFSVYPHSTDDGSVDSGKEEYTLEITPISVATRPRK